MSLGFHRVCYANQCPLHCCNIHAECDSPLKIPLCYEFVEITRPDTWVIVVIIAAVVACCAGAIALCIRLRRNKMNRMQAQAAANGSLNDQLNPNQGFNPNQGYNPPNQGFNPNQGYNPNTNQGFQNR